MNFPALARVALALFPALTAASSATAHDAAAGGAHSGGIHSATTKAATPVHPSFAVIHTKITTAGNVATFHIAVAGKPGAAKPKAIGKLAGSEVYSYVWPTSIDPGAVGFEPKSGILALAVTSHPDFDDTPLFPAPLGAWHTHWVVLQKDEQCGKAALKVADIPAGQKPRLPKTWPGLPILIDSPGWVPQFKGDALEVRVPFDDIAVVEQAAFDGVTAGLRVNASVHAPLLCVADVFRVASGDLSLPGKVNQ